MATVTATATATATQTTPMAEGAPAPAQPSPVPENASCDGGYKKLPNARPTGPELVPDQKWTTWRLRNQRPEIAADMPNTFPDISKYHYEEAHEVVQATIAEANAELATETSFKKRSFKQLRGYKPAHLAFRPMYDFYDEADRIEARRLTRSRLDDSEDHGKIPGFWFDRMSFDLFARVWDFTSNTFGVECFGSQVGTRDWSRGWLARLPEEFVKYASEVARGDPIVVPHNPTDPNNWEHLFLAKDSRVSLVVGVIAKILGDNVLGSHLFGATPGQKEALDRNDPYARNHPRSGIAKQFVLAGRTPTGYLPDLYTDGFWDEVDSVTTRILSLLLPLINMLGSLSPGAGWPPLTRVHQGLHDIVAEAGWLTNGMRVSKSVFWVQFPNPGDLWDIHQEHVTDVLWNGSKAAAARHDAKETARWKVEMETEWIATNGDKTMDSTWKQEYEKKSPPPRQPRRAAKVQIVMWPWINQYSPMRPKSDGDLNSGETITQIVKAQVAYYAGDDSDEGEARERLTLEEHIREAKRWKLRDWVLWSLVWCFAIFLLYQAYQTPYLQDARSRLQKAVQPTPAPAVDTAGAVTAKVKATDFVAAKSPIVSTVKVTEKPAVPLPSARYAGPQAIPEAYL
ncbi:hypothetical protein VSDG_04027 [Cytospora chrysosperma]|uniref:Uncharacterized protein n=1 Tax=Cytospora chrysosperma TaxID=252740 RepID=A0A423W7M7_CYTCH|nr:hypothetical protein VSDG_04027 [Valsa sordida]